MGNLARARNNLRESGIRSLINRSSRYALRESILAPGFKSLLGPVLQQKLITYLRIGYWPQIKNPRSFNEKVIHRKLFTEKDLYSLVEDKWRVREYVNERIDEDILNEVYLVTQDPEDIDFSELPASFVVKATHGSGQNIVVQDKGDHDERAIKDAAARFLSTPYGDHKYEYWYGEITPRIVVEEFMEQDDFDSLLDFKFYVFDGRVEFVHVDLDRFGEHKRTFYDRNWEKQEFTIKYPIGRDIEEPNRFDDMISIAETLGAEFDFVRVDLYQPTPDRIVFGEMTVAPGSGGAEFYPEEYDFELGKYW